ncbi:MAG: IS5 family transposase [Rhodobacteraceae bacterium]|nr:IS5 family transposase [Paracoccaceae bacterium]
MSGDRHDMSEAEWAILHSVLPHKHQGPERVHDRRVMNGIFFVLRTGTPWRDLPERYGPYTTCYDRDNRWSKNGIWASIMKELQRLAGDDGGSDDGSAGSVRLRMVDSSSVRVHRHGAGAGRDGGPPRIGSSRGGRTTKVHLGIDGNAVVKTVFLTPAQAADCAQAEALLADLGKDETVIADKAYDTDAIPDLIETAGATAVIPSKSNRKSPRSLDRET